MRHAIGLLLIAFLTVVLFSACSPSAEQPAAAEATTEPVAVAKPPSSAATSSVEPPGTNCTYGGIKVQTGIDDNGNGTLDAEEVDETQYVCHGAPGVESLVQLTTLNPGDAHCPGGGTQIDAGVDDGLPSGTANNGILDSGEIDDTQYICKDSIRLAAELTPLTDFASADSVFGEISLDGAMSRYLTDGGLRVTAQSGGIAGLIPVLTSVGPQVLNPPAISSVSVELWWARFTTFSSNNELRARLYVTAYNSGGSTGASDRTGDIFSQLMVDPAGSASGVVRRCTNAGCTTSDLIDPVPQIASGLNLDSTHVLRIDYDGDHSFTFTVSDLGGNVIGTQTHNTAAARVGPAVVPTIAPSAYINPGSPNNPQVGDGGVASAYFDNFAINGAVYDSFDAPLGRLDFAKWQQGNANREVAQGKLWLQTSSPSGRQNVDFRLRDPLSIAAMAADVTVKGYSGSSQNTRARIGGFFYNDGTAGAAPGSYVGDIFADISLTGTQAQYQVIRCTEATACTTLTSLTGGFLPLGAVTLGTTHTLYLDWDGAKFAFQMDSNPPVTFDPIAAGAPVAGPPNGNGNVERRLSVQANPAAGQADYISATFDNLRVGAAANLPLAFQLPILETFNGPALNPQVIEESEQITVGIVNGKMATTLSRPAGFSQGFIGVDRWLPSNNTVRGISADVSATFGGSNWAAAGPWGQFYLDQAGRIIAAEVDVTKLGTIEYFIFVCPADGDTCGDVSVASGTLGEYIAGSTANLSMHWNGGSVFTFGVNGTPTVVDVTATAPFASVLAAGDYGIGFEAHADTSIETSSVSLSATYDNVATSSDNNAATAFTPYDDFSAALIDLTKWDEGEEIRKQENGALRLEGRGGGTDLFVNAGLAVWAAAVDMAVLTSDDAGNFTNLNADIYRTATDFVNVDIGLTDTHARFVLARCCSNGLEILQNLDLGTVTLGSTHTVFLQWDGSKVVYQLDRNPAVSLDPVPLAGAIVSQETPNMAIEQSNLANPNCCGLIGTMSVLVDNFRGGPAIVMP